jgi:GNAT superfamily N-acetyltransferase
MGIKWGDFLPGTTVRTVYLFENNIQRAFAVVHKKDGTVYIADLIVTADSRRKGYGSRLMRSIERKVCDKPRRLEVVSKPEAVEFWESMGFVSEDPSTRSCKGKERLCWQRMSKPCRRTRRYP